MTDRNAPKYAVGAFLYGWYLRQQSQLSADSMQMGNSNEPPIKDNLPWAMNMPSNWHHPKERVDLANGYPDILNWAKSKGKK